MIAPGSLRGVAIDAAPVWLDPKFPDTSWPYDVPLPEGVDPGVVTTVTAAAAPSGAGELAISNLVLEGDTLTLTTAGGQPGRVYTVRFLLTTDAGVFEFIARQIVTPLLEDDRAPEPPSKGFGEVISTSPGGFDFSNTGNSALLLLL